MARLACVLVAVLSLQAAVKVIEWESITEQQFKSLPATQPVRVGGQQTTLGDLRAKVDARKRQTALSPRATPAAVARGGPHPAIDRMRRDQQAREVALQRDITAALTRLRADKTSVPYNTSVPVISAVIGIMQPRGAVVILGKNFGTMPGRVRLVGEEGGWSIDLEDLEWHPGGIGGTLPARPAVGSLKAKFVVELRSGAASNAWPVQWIADVTFVPDSDIGVTCGLDSNNDFCNSEGDGQEFCAAFVGQGTLRTISDAFVDQTPGAIGIVAKHENCWGAIGTDKGSDIYAINLKNGWTLYDFEWRRKSTTGASLTDPTGFPKGGSSWTFSIDWFAHPDSAMIYGGIIYIRGPKGIPHK